MNRSAFRSLLLAVFALLLVIAPSITVADDGADVDDRRARVQINELQQQMEQMQAEMEELRAMLQQMIEERDAVKPDPERTELPADLAEQMHDIKREIQELMQAGREDEANALEQRAQAMLQEYEAQQAAEGEREDEEPAEQKHELPPDLAERLEAMEREIAELRDAGRLDAAENLEREARQMIEDYRAELRESDAAAREEEWFGEGDTAESRLDHLRAAAEHLEAAGAPDLTERVRGLIDEIEQAQ